MKNIGILGYGAYIPEARIRREEYVKTWGNFYASGVVEKAVTGFDEDSVGMGVTASKRALLQSNIKPRNVSALSFASTTPPYLEKMSATSIALALGLNREIFITEHITSTRAGTEAFIGTLCYLQATNGELNGLVAASDAPTASMMSSIEHGYGAASAALVLGSGKILAKVEGFSSCAYERIGERFRPRGETSTKDLGIAAYNEKSLGTMVSSSIKNLLKNLKLSAKDFNHVVVQQPDGRLHKRIARELGFEDQQLAVGSLADVTGDTGCASVMLGLAAVLDVAEREQRILISSYGSGAGSDAISLVITDALSDARKTVGTVNEELEKKHYIDYLTYLKMKEAIR